MQKKLILFLVLILTFVYFNDSSPISINNLEFDNFNTDLSDFEAEEGDLDSFFDGDSLTSKAINNANYTPKEADTEDDNKRVKKGDFLNKYKTAELNKSFKAATAHDQSLLSKKDVVDQAKAIVAAASGEDIQDKRKYHKGTKTRGFHKVHHKDEYKKDQQFFDDDEIKGTDKKSWGRKVGVKVGAGARFKEDRYNYDRQKAVSAKTADDNYNGFFESEEFDGSMSNELW